MKRVINIFLHIPRTGGTAFMSSIERAIGAEKVIKHEHMGHISHKDAAKMLLENGGVEWFSGHERYGIHRELPPDVGVRYFSIVRQPCERLLSEYKFLVKCEEHHRHEWARQHTFADYLINKEKLFVLDNQQSRYLSGRNERVTRYTEREAAKNTYYTPAAPNPIISVVTIDRIQLHIDRLVHHGIVPDTISLITINDTKDIKVDYNCASKTPRPGLIQDLMDDYTRFDNLLYDTIAENEEPLNKIVAATDKDLNMPQIIRGEKI